MDATNQRLGATPDHKGVAFAVTAGVAAERVDVCLFDDAGNERDRLPLSRGDDGVWRGRAEGAGPGTLYGLRVAGPHDPSAGRRFDAAKVLLDPYARAVGRTPTWHDAMFERGGDTAAVAALGRVVDDAFDWENDVRPRTAWDRTVIYEAHVKGLTKLHPGVPERLRGTYAGLACEPVIDHLKRLGVTAVELMPVHAHVTERRLVEHGLTNYWGYNPLSYFAPHPAYAADPASAVAEFKGMVKALHAAGLEVILDVVYNHTCERGHADGGTLSWRGLDDAGYYRLNEKGDYIDFTGCFNTLDLSSPPTLRMVMDSLRYWATEMRVDGFRFDLCAALARDAGGDFDARGPFLSAVAQDPVLRDLKLISEPWDLGPDGYQVGRFPPIWSEWNGVFRDGVRRFWRGGATGVGDIATRLAGSADRFDHDGRGVRAGVNFVTAHDGFCLLDLVSYNDKHNAANAEDNRDGHDHNESWNCGVEGPTDDAEVVKLRDRQRRNIFATMVLAQGVPMVLGGDELSHTQRGNNNAYCQDNELTWLDWNLDERSRDFLEFCREVLRVRAENATLRRRGFLTGEDVTFLSPSGPMAGDDWADANAKTLGMLLHGEEALLLLVNAHWDDVPFALPESAGWEVLIDTADQAWTGGERYPLAGRSLAVLRAR